MKTFSELDKKVLKSLIDLDNEKKLNVFGNVIGRAGVSDYLKGTCYIHFPKKDDVKIQVRHKYLLDGAGGEPPLDLNDLNQSLSKIMLSMVTLFKYLEERRLAYFIGDNRLDSLGIVFGAEVYIPCAFLEKESQELIYYYGRKTIYVSEELKELVLNDFLSKDEIRSKKQQSNVLLQIRLTQAATLLTFFGLMWTVTTTFLLKNEVTIKNDSIIVKVDQEVFDKINFLEDELKVSSEEINESIKLLQSDLDRQKKEIKNALNKAVNNKDVSAKK